MWPVSTTWERPSFKDPSLSRTDSTMSPNTVDMRTIPQTAVSQATKRVNHFCCCSAALGPTTAVSLLEAHGDEGGSIAPASACVPGSAMYVHACHNPSATDGAPPTTVKRHPRTTVANKVASINAMVWLDVFMIHVSNLYSKTPRTLRRERRVSIISGSSSVCVSAAGITLASGVL